MIIINFLLAGLITLLYYIILGKSTTLSLLYRIADPLSGRITIDGHDIRDIKLSTLRQNIAVVFQESLLLNRSILENLKVGKEHKISH